MAAAAASRLLPSLFSKFGRNYARHYRADGTVYHRMGLFTRRPHAIPPNTPHQTELFSKVREETSAALWQAGELNPRVSRLVREAPAIPSGTRVGHVIELLRVSPYRAVPVVEPIAPAASDATPIRRARLLGLVTEERLVAALLAAQTPALRDDIRQMCVASFLEPPTVGASLGMYASEAFALMRETGRDVLPVLDGYGGYVGLLSRSDLVQDLVRPFRPPQVGGMATPLGVYLTTGAVSGGAGTLALVLTGIAMFSVHTLAFFLGMPLEQWSEAVLPAALSPLLAEAPGSVRAALSLLVSSLVQVSLFLLLIRLTPIAGYHAAEHQVVHALERSEPLLIANVRSMPRVHPRCGTNLVAGILLLFLPGKALEPVLGDVAFLASGLLALAYWRSFGGWLQHHLTTRPASEVQLESGIRAAQELLTRHGRAPHAAVKPHIRLWRMGMVQILLGFACGYGLLFAAGVLWQPFGAAIRPYLHTVW